MRRLLCTLTLALGVGACGKQLNPEFCLHNPNDGECRDAGLVFIDAPPPCSSDGTCTGAGKGVCDVNLGTCVQCTASDHSACTGATPICSTADVCVGCVLDGDCASGLCLPEGTCAAVGDVLFVSVAGGGTCHTALLPCTIQVALGVARTGGGHVLQLAGGDYHVGPLTFDIPNLEILQSAGEIATITTDANGPIISVTAGPVEIDDITIYAAKNDDAIACTNATLTLEHVTLRDNPHDGVDAEGCALTVERSTFTRNNDHAIEADDSQIKIRNDFIYDNGNNNTTDGAVSLTGTTQGELRFTTFGFNAGKHVSGLDCSPSNTVNATDNLFADNDSQQLQSNSHCSTSRSWIGDAGDVHFVSANPPYDLHLTVNTPTRSPNAIRDNANTVCNDVDIDVDGDTRPINQACDLGADEFKP